MIILTNQYKIGDKVTTCIERINLLKEIGKYEIDYTLTSLEKCSDNQCNEQCKKIYTISDVSRGYIKTEYRKTQMHFTWFRRYEPYRILKSYNRLTYL